MVWLNILANEAWPDKNVDFVAVFGVKLEIDHCERRVKRLEFHL